MFLSMSINLSLADLPALLDTDNEECPPLVVEPPAHSSQVVMDGTVPTITVSSSVVETTLSARSEGPPGPVLTLLLILWDGVNTHGLNKTSTRPLNGLGISVAPDPWGISS